MLLSKGSPLVPRKGAFEALGAVSPPLSVVNTTSSPAATTTTTTTTSSPADYGDSYKANDECSKALEQDKCESQGCSWR